MSGIDDFLKHDTNRQSYRKTIPPTTFEINFHPRGTYTRRTGWRKPTWPMQFSPFSFPPLIFPRTIFFFQAAIPP